jgi:UDP-galactopyranose mutase
MAEKVKHLILGAGITGLSTGLHLKRDYLILEKEDRPGGLARSKKIGGYIFDFSAHLLHCKTRYFLTWLQKHLNGELQIHKRNAWVYSHGVYTKYPFQVNLYGLPKNVVKECIRGLLTIDEKSAQKEKNFYRWCYKKFGSGIARHFFLPYNFKFWTLNPSYLTTEWVDGFIPQPEIEDILDGTFDYSRKEFGYHSKFFYPRTGGIEVFTKKLAEFCKDKIINETVKELNLKERWVITEKGNKYLFENLISTIPLPELGKIILDGDKDWKKIFKKLRHTSVININLGVNRKEISKKDWIYFPESNLIFYRVGFPMNFAPHSTPRGKSSLYIDISYSQWKPLDKKVVLSQVITDLVKVGILERNDELEVQDVNDIKYAYIIYDKNWHYARNKILSWLGRYRVYCGGRFGGWRYLSMEGCFLEGKNITQLIKNG